MHPQRVIIVGERDEEKRAHLGIEKSLELFGAFRGRALIFEWICSDSLTEKNCAERLGGAGGLWCAPGSPYASTEGALLAVRHARVKEIPFLGTCGGFQHALMEYCDSVLGRKAIHEELDPGGDSSLIVKLSCSLAGAKASVFATPGSPYKRLMGRIESVEEFNCNYGMAPSFEAVFRDSDLEFVARDEAGQVRVFWHRIHPFFVGTLFQPERRAFAGEIHPVVAAFLGHACGQLH